jgi:hypothetical protein
MAVEMTRIYWGKEAQDAFGHLVTRRDAEKMRAEDRDAFKRIGELLVVQRLLLLNLQRRGK